MYSFDCLSSGTLCLLNSDVASSIGSHQVEVSHCIVSYGYIGRSGPHTPGKNLVSKPRPGDSSRGVENRSRVAGRQPRSVRACVSHVL